MHPGRLAGGEAIARVERLGELQRARNELPLRGLEPVGQRAERRRRARRMELDDGDHAVFYGCMGWITEWRRKRVLQKHAIDEALWRRATAGLAFLPQAQKLRELALLFLAEKQFAGAHGVEVTDEMRVAIAAQACLLILELGLDWYAGWTGIVVYPGDFRVRRTEVDEDGIVHEWVDDLEGAAMP